MTNELVTQEAKPPASTDAPAEFLARLDEFVRDIELVKGKWTLSRLLTTPERNMLGERARALAARMRPMGLAVGEMDAATAEIGALMAGYPNLKTDPARLVAGFVALLKDLPLFAVKHACALLREGAVDSVSPEYPPTAPLIFKLAREHAEPYWDEAAKIKRVLSVMQAREPMLPPRLNREEQLAANDRVEAMRKQIADLAAASRLNERDKIKADAKAARERIDEKKREAWRQVGREPMFDREGYMLWPSSVPAEHMPPVRDKDFYKDASDGDQV